MYLSHLGRIQFSFNQDTRSVITLWNSFSLSKNKLFIPFVYSRRYACLAPATLLMNW